MKLNIGLLKDVVKRLRIRENIRDIARLYKIPVEDLKAQVREYRSSKKGRVLKKQSDKEELRIIDHALKVLKDKVVHPKTIKKEKTIKGTPIKPIKIKKEKIIKEPRVKKVQPPKVIKPPTIKQSNQVAKDHKYYELDVKLWRFSEQGIPQYHISYNMDDVLKKFGKNPVCYITGLKIDLTDKKAYSLDHIVPKHKGGTNELSNMGLCNAIVNMMKSYYTLDEFKFWCEVVTKNK
jgi:hypothetical protein